MNFSTIKKLAVTSAVALTLGLGSQAYAQSATVPTSFVTADALAVATNGTIDFGTHAINIAGGDTLLLVLSAANAAGSAATTSCTGAVDPATTCTEVVAPTATGGVDIDVPVDNTDVQISGTVSTDFGNPSLSLGTLTYTEGATTDAALPAAFDGTTVNVALATTPEFVGIGGTLTISGTTPAAATTFADAEVTFNVSY